MGIVYGGIDAGESGALTLLEAKQDSAKVLVFDFNNPEGLAALKAIGLNLWDVKAFIMLERQQAFPKQGAVSGFKLGTNYGRWYGRLEALEIPFTFISAKKWQNHFFRAMPKIWMKRKGAKVLDTKKMSLEAARLRFPDMADRWLKRAKDHNRADSMLIAEYARLAYIGKINIS